MSIIGVGQAAAGKTVFSGIQPTGVFHLGNLLGAIQSWVDLSRNASTQTPVVFMIADLHAITVRKAPETLRELRWQALASIIASGIDHDRCALYFQSQVPAHAQLHWLLSSISSMGYLNRMTQWKSKANLDEKASINTLQTAQMTDLNLGLYSYPTLQAADVLVHQAHYVPVGEDQAQHLELTRHLAQTFNSRYGNVFNIPSTVLSDMKKVQSLRDHTKKMSKSDPDQSSCIYITDSPDTISKKLRRAITDSIQGPITFDPESRPGVSNLLSIAAGLTGVSPEQYLEDSRPRDHKELKDNVAQTAIESLKPLRLRYNELEKDNPSQ